MKTLLSLFLLLISSALVYAGEPYDGYSEDKILLRSTTNIPAGSNSEKTIKASSDKAMQAAHRLFSNVSMLFKTRDEVLAILGDPTRALADGSLLSSFATTVFGWCKQMVSIDLIRNRDKSKHNKPRHPTTTSRPVPMIPRSLNINPVIAFRPRW